MLKKTIEYESLDGETVKEDFYFHLSKADLAKMMMSDDNLEARLHRIVAAKDGAAVVREFENIIKLSYGRRSSDGKVFIRDEQATKEFMGSEAYSVLFMELMTDAKAGAAFMRGLVPRGLQAELDEKLEINKRLDEVEKSVPPAEDNRPAWEREDRDPTKAELMVMSPDEMRRAFAARLRKN